MRGGREEGIKDAELEDIEHLRTMRSAGGGDGGEGVGKGECAAVAEMAKMAAEKGAGNAGEADAAEEAGNVDGGEEGGEAIAADPAEAMIWLRAAADYGHPDAQIEVGRLLLAEAEAEVEVEAEAAAMGTAQGAGKYGHDRDAKGGQGGGGGARDCSSGPRGIYVRDDGNVVPGVLWLERAASQGDIEAVFELARLWRREGEWARLWGLLYGHARSQMGRTSKWEGWRA